MAFEIQSCSICNLCSVCITQLQNMFTKKTSPTAKKKTTHIKQKIYHKDEIDELYKKYIYNHPCGICKHNISNDKYIVFNKCQHIVHKKCIHHNQYYHLFHNKYIDKHSYTFHKIHIPCPICDKKLFIH